MFVDGTNPTVKELFEKAIEIENRAEEFYRILADIFSHYDKVSNFWNSLAADEVMHSKTLQNIYKSIPEQKLVSLPDEKIYESVNMIYNFVQKDMISGINNLDDAYEAAHEFEFSEINAIFKILVTEFIQVDERRKFIVSEIMNHQKKLVDFSKNFGDRRWRREVLVRRSKP